MKHLILILFVCTGSLFGQESFQIDIKFGNYHNDHEEKKFYVKERNWSLADKILIYKIQEIDVVYSDTIELKPEENDSIYRFILEKELNTNLEKTEKSKFLDKYGRTSLIQSKVILKEEEFNIWLRGEGAVSLDRTLKGSRLKLLEDYFYAIVDDRNPKKKKKSK